MQHMRSRHTKNPFAALAAELSKPAMVPSRKDGWLSYVEVLAEAGMGHNRTRNMLREGIRTGRVEVWEGSDLGLNGKPARCVKYRLKKISAKKLATASGRVNCP